MRQLIVALTLAAVAAITAAYISVPGNRDVASQRNYRGTSHGYPVAEGNQPASW